MRDRLRVALETEMTRKQFLQYLAGILLMVFGLDNLLSLLFGDKNHIHLPSGTNASTADGVGGFGTRKFGE